MSERKAPARAAVDRRAETAPGASADILDQLCAVVMRSGFGRSNSYSFIGWTDSPTPLPIVSENVTDLSPAARQSLRLYLASKHDIPRISAETIIPVEFQAPDEMKNYPDEGNVRSLDLFRIFVRDVSNRLPGVAYIDESAGLKELAVDELTLLKAIANRVTPWQDVGDDANAKKIYTVFIPTEGQHATAIALMFRPALQGMSNEKTVSLFIVDTVSKLLALERTSSDREKGYIRAAERFLETVGLQGQAPSAGIFDVLLVLRELGLLSFGFTWFKRLADRSGFFSRAQYLIESAALAGGYLAQGPGVGTGSENLIQLQSRIAELDIANLFVLAEVLASVARSVFSR